jgi:uncharacterized protein YfaS (alpha-2-macroglobulin family)
MKALLSFVIGTIFAGMLIAFGINDEVRLGSLEGTVLMTENNKHLPGATVILRQLNEATGTYHSFKTIKSDDQGAFDFGRVPAGSYSVESYAKAHSADEAKFSVREGEAKNYTVRMEPGEPYLRVFAPKHVYLPQAKPELTVEGFGQDPDLKITLFKVDFNKVVAGGGLQSVLQTAWRWDDGIRTEDPTVYKQLKTETRPIDRRDVEGAYVEAVNLDALPSGMYWISARTGKSLRSGTYVLVSNIALVTKRVNREIHGFVSHMDTGKAISNANFSIYSGANSIASGKTDANGFITLSVPSAVDGNVTAVAVSGNERAVVPVYMYSESQNNIRASIVTDRPIYRPGHTVQYKGIARRLNGLRYSIPANVPVEIDIQDTDAVSIKKERLVTDEFGGFSGSFDINPEATTGDFAIYATISGSETYQDVRVASYRKPDFEVTVSAEKSYYVRGERISGTVDVQYYFGGAVPEAKVEVSVYRRPHYGDYEEYFSEYEGGDSGEYIGDLTAVTNGSGKARFTYETTSLRDPETDYVYTFEASVSDDSGRYFDGSGSVRVTRGDFELIAISENYIADLNGEASIRVETKTFDGKPVDKDVDISYGIEIWEGDKARTTSLGRTTTSTRNGIATVSARATQTGYMIFTVTSRDNRGNTIISRTGVYVPGVGDWGQATRSLSVRMDKNKYALGDSARAAIIAPTDGDAWVTVEGRDIYESKKVSLNQGGNVVDLEIDERMLPNAHVTVQYVRAATYYEGMSELSVDQTSQKMSVIVTPGKPKYEPGETAVFNIKTTDIVSGEPVSADLSFGLVDESIYAIREDNIDLLSEFYPMRYSSIFTGHSLQEIYLGDGDKDSVQIDVRRRFLDTAHWQPSIVTNSNGEATVTVVLPDNLTAWRATARGLSVQDSLVGQGVAKITAAKPLMVRLNLPRFLVQGDEVEISATVNTSDATMDAAVTLEATGVVLDDAPRKAVKVSPNNPQTLRWKIRADKPGSATFRALVGSGEPVTRDAVEMSIETIAMGRLVTGYQVGEAVGRKPLELKTDGYLEGSGKIEIVVASSFIDTLGGSFDYLVDYPYGCVEQTMSRFMPALIVSKSQLAETLSPQTKAKLPEVIANSFVRLRSMQNSDGSWGWFTSDTGEPYMTGIVLEGYGLAAEAGRPPNPDSRSRAIQWAEQWLAIPENSKPDARSARLWLIRGLASVGAAEIVSKALLETNFRDLTTDDWASIALAAHRIGNKELASRSIAQIKARANVSENNASWKSDWYGTTTSAQATLAIATVTPSDPIVMKAVRNLLQSRRGNYWHSTQDTALAILAIMRAESQFPRGANSQMVKVVSGAETLDLGTISAGSPKRFEISMDKTMQNGASIEVDAGRVYFTSNYRYRVNDETVKTGQRGDGLSVTREYFELKPRRLANGALRLVAAGSPIRRLSPGETVRVVVKINSGRHRGYMMLEDPIPSGFEVLERASDGAQEWEWFYWYSGIDVRDDRIVYFMRNLPQGDHVIEYTLRAESVGKVTALPATLSSMYEPDDHALTAARSIEVAR